jgi:hypothetical protein
MPWDEGPARVESDDSKGAGSQSIMQEECS